MTTRTITVSGETITIEQRENGYCYLAGSGSPICETPQSWPTDDLDEAVQITRKAFA